MTFPRVENHNIFMKPFGNFLKIEGFFIIIDKFPKFIKDSIIVIITKV